MFATVEWDVFFAPLVIGLGFFGFVFTISGDRRTRIAFAAATAASVALVYATFFMSLCGLNDSGVPWEACNAGTYNWPLAGIPPLFLLALVAGRTRGPAIWLLGAAVFACALAVPWFVLTSGR